MGDQNQYGEGEEMLWGVGKKIEGEWEYVQIHNETIAGIVLGRRPHESEMDFLTQYIMYTEPGLI